MTTVSTSFQLPATADVVVIAAQDIVDRNGWRVLTMTSTEIVISEGDYDIIKGSKPKLTIALHAAGENTRVVVTSSIFGYGPIAKKMVNGFMGQFVNSLSLRVQTNSVAINPTVQVGEGQSSGGTTQPDRFDLLRKAKELLDSGVLTEEEFMTEKKKILGE